MIDNRQYANLYFKTTERIQYHTLWLITQARAVTWADHQWCMTFARHCNKIYASKCYLCCILVPMAIRVNSSVGVNVTLDG